MVTTKELTQSLVGAGFPTDKDELYDVALDNEATEDILAALDKLPDQEYESLAEIIDILTDEGAEELINIHEEEVYDADEE